MFFESFGVMACLRLDLYTTSVRCLAASICMIYALLHDSHNPQIVRPTGSKLPALPYPSVGWVTKAVGFSRPDGHPSYMYVNYLVDNIMSISHIASSVCPRPCT